MTEVRFYHLMHKRLEQALPQIIGKVLERQMRAVIKAGSPERLEAIDMALWTHDPASFLPHGRIKDGHEADQPVWLTTEDDNPNGATLLVLADGATSDQVGSYDLCCEFFDGNDDDAVIAARQRWALYKDKGFSVTYFQQDDQGRWVQK